MLCLIGKFFQAGAIGFAVPRLQNDTRMSYSNSLLPGRVAAHTQLMLFRRASTRDVNHESLMTLGSGWLVFQSPDTQAWQNDYLQGTGCEMYTETLSPSFTGMTFPQASE